MEWFLTGTGPLIRHLVDLTWAGVLTLAVCKAVERE